MNVLRREVTPDDPRQPSGFQLRFRHRRRAKLEGEALKRDITMQLIMADVNDRRSEINNRTIAQHLLINLNISAAGVISGVVLTGSERNRPLLLLLAPICSALAMLWANHDRTIMQIIWSLQDDVKPVVEEIDRRLWAWQFSSRRYQTERGVRWSFVFPIFLTFVGPPVLALISTFSDFVLEGTATSVVTFALAALVTAGAAVTLAQRDRGRARRRRTTAVDDVTAPF